ncbi:MAG TPA: hypothetical protein VK249_12870 [Anaerolineales bacterium]|nr:hypothetical protein [Anaerolineales bacterium]
MINDENNKAANSVTLETGRFLFTLVIGLFVFSEFTSLMVGNFGILRIIISALLLFLVYEGYRWARILLGILAGLGSILGAVAVILLASQDPAWGQLLAILSMTGASVGITFILLLSKSTIAFLEIRKQLSKYPESIVQEYSLPLPQYHDLSEKIRSQLASELPTYEISTVLPINNSEDEIVMLKYVAAFRNIFRCKPDGVVVWQAELPISSGDVYTNVEWKDKHLTAFSRSLIAVRLDVETGKILPARGV